mgnify:CR=1 FL=1
MLKKGSRRQNGITYKLLADIYLFWKQYDLAVYNYKLSNQIYESIETKIVIAETQFLLKEYEEGEKLHQIVFHAFFSYE